MLSTQQVDELDRGHRHGNFPRYYDFHPPQERVDMLCPAEGVLDRVVTAAVGKSSASSTPFSYLDIGCNAGDLTVRVAEELQKRNLPLSHLQVQTVGLDIDPGLIARAKKVHGSDAVQFDVCNVLDDSFNPPASDFVTIFSTTMWLHIHGGDKGLRRVLTRLGGACRGHLLVEPQPSKCYRVAQSRLRKLERPNVFDVSKDRLNMRPKIEQEIEAVLVSCGFRRVEGLGGLSDDERTSWNRSIRLYERVEAKKDADEGEDVVMRKTRENFGD